MNILGQEECDKVNNPILFEGCIEASEVLAC